MVKVMRMMMVKMVGGEEEEGADQRFTFYFTLQCGGRSKSPQASKHCGRTSTVRLALRGVPKVHRGFQDGEDGPSEGFPSGGSLSEPLCSCYFNLLRSTTRGC